MTSKESKSNTPTFDHIEAIFKAVREKDIAIQELRQEQEYLKYKLSIIQNRLRDLYK